MNVNFINQSNQRKFSNYKKDCNDIFNQCKERFNLPKQTTVSCILVDDMTMHQYNHTYRNKDYATDVLTFVDDQDESYLGDVIINVVALEKQAKEYDHTIKREMCFLFAHGLLHTLGFDHQNEQEEAIMIAHQKEILQHVSKRSYRKSNR